MKSIGRRPDLSGGTFKYMSPELSASLSEFDDVGQTDYHEH